MNSQQGGVMGLVFPIVLFVAIFYFLILRPQKKKQQQHEKMLASISRGDTVISAGGFYGKVSDVLDDSYIIEIAEGVKARILKSSISVRCDSTDPRQKTAKQKKKSRPRQETDSVEETTTESNGNGGKKETHGKEVNREESRVLLEGKSPDGPDAELGAPENENR